MSSNREIQRGILLLNTGTPIAPTAHEVQRYLGDFLTDHRVMQLPSLLRTLLVRGLIAPLRGPISAKRYQQIWQDEGSPLLTYTEQLAEKVARYSSLPTFVGMRYNRDSIQRALAQAVAQGVEELTLVPLFPHYAMSSFESAVAYSYALAKEQYPDLSLQCLAPYALRPEYITLLAEQVARYAPVDSHLLLSYHGIPLKQSAPYEGDPEKDYRYQCQQMTQLLIEHPLVTPLGLSHEVAFQSRFGTTKWLTPPTDRRIRELPREGVRQVTLLCPSFVCDNLETLWEIDIEERKNFHAAGGDSLTLIPCLNDSATVAQLFARWVKEKEGVSDASHWIAP